MSIEFNEGYLKDITEISERSKSNSAKIADLEDDVKAIKEENKAIHDIATSVKLIAQDMTYIKSDIATVKETQADLTEQVSTLKEEPARTKAQWVDNIGRLVITSIVTGIVAFLLGNCFPQIFG